jgi:CheY-like chemotaxis protein
MKGLRRILLVEDDPEDTDLIMNSLAEYQLSNVVVAVKNGEEALDYLNYRGKYRERTDGYPVVIILDLKLPGTDGMEVLRQVKSDNRLKLLPVVILTSSLEDRDVAAGYKLGANSYIVKPIDFNQFVSVIKRLGSYWAIVNEPPSVEGTGKGIRI